MPSFPDPQRLSAPPASHRYGWVIVALTLLMQTVSSGLGFYNMSVYINRLTVELVVSLADISFAVSLFFVVGGIAGLYVADLLRVWSVRGGTLLYFVRDVQCGLNSLHHLKNSNIMMNVIHNHKDR